MASKHYENKAKRAWWSVHVEAWQRSGLTKRAYCGKHRLQEDTFRVWLKVLVDAEALRLKQELERQERRDRLRRERQPVSTDQKNRATRAFWAMHVEAMRWSGMRLNTYARALGISAYSLARWRDIFDAEGVEEDWRARLHPSARANLSTSAKPSAKAPVVESDLTAAPPDGAEAAMKTTRRSFNVEQKLVIVRETERPGETVSSVARRHRIVASMVFRWRAELGLGKGKRSKLAMVRLGDGEAGAPSGLRALHDLVRPPEGMAAVNLGDGRRVFAPIGSDPDAVRRKVAKQETPP